MQISISNVIGRAITLGSLVSKIIKSFKKRVAADGGIFEAEACLNATLTNLNDIQLLKEPSLCVTPNAYEEDILFSVIPSDGSGDMDVVRATTATRVNEQGFIEVVPKNLASYSEQFDNGVWVKNAVNITANATTAPDGNLTADTIVENTSNSEHNTVQTINVVSGIAYTCSVYFKVNTRTKAGIQLAGLPFNVGGNGKAIFDLSNGSIISTSGNATATIQSVGNGWYRCTATKTSAATGLGVIAISIVDSSNNFSYLGDGTSGLYIWGAQLEQGSTVTSYFPTTDRLNIPRIDYTNGGCPSILVEPQRTNLLLRSEEFDNAVWNKTRLNAFGLGSIANATTAPDGTTTADYIQQETGVTIVGGVNRAISVTSGTIYSLSVFAKQDDNRFLRLGFAIGTGSEGIFCNFDLQDGITGTPSAGITPTITNFGNGWFRCSISATSQVTANANQFIYQANGLNATIATPDTGIFIWGAQLEVGSNATSYIPTVASAVTRNADVISKTGISGLIGQTEGTVVLDFKNRLLQSYPQEYVLLIRNTSGSNQLWIRKELGSNSFTIRLIVNNVVIWTFAGINVLDGENKIGISYKTLSSSVYLNGVKIGNTNTSPFNSMLLENLYLNYNGGSIPDLKLKSLQLYKTKLTDAECIALTTI